MSLLDYRLPKRYEGEFDVKIKKYIPIENENGGYEVVPYPDEVGKGYFQTKAYVHKNWVIDDEQ